MRYLGRTQDGKPLKSVKENISIITMDGLILFAGTIILLDFLETKNLTFTDSFKKIILNPPLIAVLVGLVFGLSKSKIPVGVEVFLNAIAVSASPVLLFALGIILSRPYKGANLALPLIMTFIKLIIHPIFAGIIFTAALALPTEIKNPAIMTAAAPCGLMSFMLALNYKVKVDVIARAILISSVGSTITISLAAAL